jgi:putative ABC transport system permease protein
MQSLFLASMAFIPGFIASMGLYSIIKQATLLPIYMTPERTSFVFLLTLIMCFLSGLIATRKLRDADPVDIF